MKERLFGEQLSPIFRKGYQREKNFNCFISNGYFAPELATDMYRRAVYLSDN